MVKNSIFPTLLHSTSHEAKRNVRIVKPILLVSWTVNNSYRGRVVWVVMEMKTLYERRLNRLETIGTYRASQVCDEEGILRYRDDVPWVEHWRRRNCHVQRKEWGRDIHVIDMCASWICAIQMSQRTKEDGKKHCDFCSHSSPTTSEKITRSGPFLVQPSTHPLDS